MKKQKKAALAALLCAALLGAGSTAQAAAKNNPFDDVPKDHWAYHSIEVLRNEGIVKGNGNGEFRGGAKVMRYEMAAVVGKALSRAKKQGISPEGQKELDKLSGEFYDELKHLGVRMQAFEKYKPKAAISGDIRMRYIGNPKHNTMKGGPKTSGSFENRVRLTYYTDVHPGTSFTGRICYGNSTKNRWNGLGTDASPTDYDGSFYVEVAQLDFKNGKSDLSLGRMDRKFGLGVIAPGLYDGAVLTYAPDSKTTLRAGIGSMNAEENGSLVDKHEAVPIFHAEAMRTFGQTTLTFSHLRTLRHPATTGIFQPWNAGGTVANYYEIPLALEQYAIGIKAPIASRLSFTGEFVTNRAGGLRDDYSVGAQGRPDATHKSVRRNGWWASLNYGNLDMAKPHTYEVDLVYMHMGNWAIDSTGYGHALWSNGGNYLGMDGAKGWGIQLQYMLGRNVDLTADYFFMKPIDAKSAGFSEYRSPWQIALNYFFW
ncbi:MAG: S-layer homology domain-containing protein [Selenomonadaceae bacterium]|nr:S-layer homology domain-containing protein [Selenomonadaceae bacterium]